MKLNACFEPEWCNIYRTPDFDDLFQDLVYVPEEDAYITILFNSDSLVNRIELLKFDSEGSTIWRNLYVSNPDFFGEYPICLEYSALDTSALLTGFVVYDSYLHPYLLKVNSNGDFEWEEYEVPDSSFVWGESRERPVILDDGKIINPIVANPEMIGKLVSFDYNGNIEWLSNLYKPDTILYNINTTMDVLNNNLYIGLQYFKTGYDALGNGIIQKVDTLGNFIDEAVLPVDFTAIVYDICPTHDNKILISSSHNINSTDYMLIKYNEDLEYDSINTQPLIYDSLCPEGITSGTIPLNCNVITSTNSLKGGTIPTLILAPNPAKDYTIIYLPDGLVTSENIPYNVVYKYRTDYIHNLSMRIYDANGVMIYESAWPDNSKEMVLPTSSLTGGLDFIRIINPEGKVIASGKLMIIK